MGGGHFHLFCNVELFLFFRNRVAPASTKMKEFSAVFAAWFFAFSFFFLFVFFSLKVGGRKTAQEKKQIPGNGGSHELFGPVFP